MKTKYLLIFSLSLISFKSYTQFTLPKVGTTQEKAINDLVKNVTNENWFSYKQDDGTVCYSKLFKSTPVGIRHALNEYEDLVNMYNAKDCNDKSLYSSIVKNSSGEIDYDNLSHSIQMESSEIRKTCFVKDNAIVGFRLISGGSSRNAFLTIYLTTNLK
jgi:hypothetical protein